MVLPKEFPLSPRLYKCFKSFKSLFVPGQLFSEGFKYTFPKFFPALCRYNWVTSVECSLNPKIDAKSTRMRNKYFLAVPVSRNRSSLSLSRNSWTINWLLILPFRYWHIYLHKKSSTQNICAIWNSTSADSFPGFSFDETFHLFPFAASILAARRSFDFKISVRWTTILGISRTYPDRNGLNTSWKNFEGSMWVSALGRSRFFLICSTLKTLRYDLSGFSTKTSYPSIVTTMQGPSHSISFYG